MLHLRTAFIFKKLHSLDQNNNFLGQCRHCSNIPFMIRHRASARERDGSRHLLLVLISGPLVLWSSGPGGPGPLVLALVLGFWMLLREAPTPARMAFFLDFCCVIFWHRLGTPFFLILVPTWVQPASQLGDKIHQTSSQEGFKFQANLHYVFDTLFL